MTFVAKIFFSPLKVSLLILCLFFLLAIKTSSPHTLQPDSIIIVTGNYAPALDEDAKDKGYVARLVTDAFALANIKTKFIFVPWARAIRMVRRNKEVAVMYYAKTKDGAKDFLYSEPLFQSTWLFFHLKTTKLHWQKLADLAPYQIGAAFGYTYTEQFNDFADERVLNVHWASRDEQNWRMLMVGRIDLYPSPENIAWYQLKQLFNVKTLDLITADPKPFKTQLNYLLFAKNHPQAKYFKEKFNIGFNKLKKLKKISDYIPGIENKHWPIEPSIIPTNNN